MTREIKFRGKSLIDGRWIYGDLFRTDLEGGVSIQYYDEVDGWMTEEVNPETIGQFTGIKDGNGTEIFEGDILDTPIHKGMLVIFGTGSFCMNTFSGATHYFDAWIDKIDQFRVMDNIHDNPELMEGGEK